MREASKPCHGLNREIENIYVYMRNIPFYTSTYIYYKMKYAVISEKKRPKERAE